MTRKRVFIFVNGILNNPGSAEGWTDRAVTWIHQNTYHSAEKFEYWAGPITRRFQQAKHARALSELIAGYDSANFEIVLVGHSNGSDLICRALKMGSAHIKAIHLISPACDASFEKNGLNLALRCFVGSVCVYIGEQDKALRFAYLTEKFLGLIGLGYGSLGLTGPLLVDPQIADKVKTTRFEYFSHSTIFEKQNFERLMNLISAPATSTKPNVIR